MALPDAHGRVVAQLMTACGVAVEEVAFFSDPEPGTYLAFGRMDNPDFWYELSVTWLSLGADRVISVFHSRRHPSQSWMITLSPSRIRRWVDAKLAWSAGVSG